MRPLSPAGLQAIHDLAQRHGFSPDAVLCMLEAVIQAAPEDAQALSLLGTAYMRVGNTEQGE